MFELNLENENQNRVNINDGENYVVLSCTGLNPPSAEIFTSKSPNKKGVKYNGSTLYERNIVITIKLLGDIEANRNALYDWINSEQYCKIYYRNGIKNVYCEGHVQDCGIDLFTANEIVSLVIICEDPYWKDLQMIAIDISFLIKQFTFPFAIDSAGVPISTLRDSVITNIYNAGAETGCEIIITCKGTVKNIIVFNANDTSKRFKINTTLLENWIVVINSDGSPKTCKCYKPDGSVENLLKYVDNNPTWFTLKRGNNLFDYSADVGKSNIEMQISFTNKYLGV